jgi:hypothetical protein
MPTHEESAAFLRDFRQGWFRRGRRVKPVRGAPDLFEMSWAPNGRATFSWGDPVIAGTRHVLWHRCGDHNILP